MSRAERWRGALLSFTLLCVTTGCESGATRSHTIYDEGVPIVLSEWEVLEGSEPWRLEPDPALRIGVVEGEPAYVLSRIGDVRRLDDGRIVVQNNAVELRFYGPDGVHLRTVGGRGEGPGEFRSIGGLVFTRDTLFAFDPLALRISMWDRGGQFLQRLPPWPQLTEIKGGPARLVAVLPDGRFIFTAAGALAPRRDAVGVYWSAMPDVALHRDGSKADSLVMTGMEWLAGYGEVLIPPHHRRVFSAVNSDRLVSIHSDHFDVEVRDAASGALQMVARVNRQPRPLNQGEFSRALDRQVEELANMLGDQERRSRLQTLAAAARPHETLPTWSHVMLADDGQIWAMDYPAGDEEVQHYTIFGTHGSAVARAEVPLGLAVNQIGRDFILGVETDEMGVQSVVYYRLQLGR